MSIAEPKDNDLDDNYYELHVIYLHPDYYRQGVGSKALDFAFKKAISLGKTDMVVWVLSENENVIKFYEKCGFYADGKTKTKEYGKILELMRMRKKL